MKTSLNNIFKKINFLLLSCFVLFISSSCGTAGDILKLFFEQPKVSIKSFGLDDYNTERFNFKLVFNVENPNSIGIKTKNVDYNLDINNSDIIKGVLTNGINIDAKKTSTLEVPIQVNFQKLLQAVPTILLNINNLNYKVYGTVNFDTPIGTIPINWNKEDKLNIPTLLSQ